MAATGGHTNGDGVKRQPAALAGLSFRLGTPRPLTQLAGAIPAEIAELLRRGQRMCPVAESEAPLLAASIQASLDRAGVAVAEIDRIIITSESILISSSKPAHEAARAQLYGQLARLGLAHAPVVMLTFAGCSSAVSALEYASLLVDSGMADNVLVAAVDRVLNSAQRVLAPTVSVVGDGVASCVVTCKRDAPDGLVLRWIRRRAFLNVAEHDRATDFGPALVMLGRSLAALGREIRAQHLVPEDTWLTCNNYGLPTLRLFSRTLGIPDERVFTANVAEIGHLGSPDPLVNLASLPAFATGSGDAGALVLATSPADCALAYVTTR